MGYWTYDVNMELYGILMGVKSLGRVPSGNLTYNYAVVEFIREKW